MFQKQIVLRSGFLPGTVWTSPKETELGIPSMIFRTTEVILKISSQEFISDKLESENMDFPICFQECLVESAAFWTPRAPFNTHPG